MKKNKYLLRIVFFTICATFAQIEKLRKIMQRFR